MSSKQKQKHPFGRENEVSVQLLFRSFCNHIRLGQWELAASCVAELKDQKDLLKVDILSVLHDISRNLGAISIPSDSVPSPHHLSWLALGALKKLQKHETNKTEQLVGLQRNVEFRILLFENCKDVEPEILKELWEFFKNCDSSNLSPADETTLSAKAQEYLSSILLSNPHTGYLLLSYLFSVEHRSQTEPEKLSKFYEIHLRCLRILLTEIEHAAKEGNQTGLERGCDTHKSKFLDLLSCYDPAESSENTNLLEFIRDVVDYVSKQDGAILTQQEVLSSLLGRRTSHLVDTFCKEFSAAQVAHYHDNVTDHQQHGGYVERQSYVQRNQLWLGLSCDPNREDAWRHMYLTCYKLERHFLETFIDVAISLIQTGDIQNLQRLFLPVEFHPLKSMVLLLGWELCSDVQTARDVLDVLWDPENKPLLGCMTAACNRLSYQVQLTEWCLDKIRTLSGVPLTPVKSGIKSFFRGLELHSALYLLHHSSRLSALNPQQVFNFLKDSPTQGTAQATTQTIKQVHFSKQVPSDDFKVELEKDLAHYRAFCIIRAFMTIVVFSEEHPSPWDAKAKFSERTAEQDVDISADADNVKDQELNTNFINVGTCSHADIAVTKCLDSMILYKSSAHQRQTQIAKRKQYRKSYQERVLETLKEAKSHISQLFPLNYRLEVLENIFSLLFVTRDDVSGKAPDVWDSGDEGAIGERREDPEVGEEGQPTVCESSQDLENCEETGKPQGSIHRECQVMDHPADTSTKPAFSPQEHLSAGSSHSAGACGRHVGFIVNEFVLRDVLMVLRETLEDLGTANQAIARNQGTAQSLSAQPCNLPSKSQHTLLTEVIECSIPMDQIQQHRSQLTQYISEGLWRFQLVSHDWVPKDFGKLPEDSLNLESSMTSDLDIESFQGGDTNIANYQMQRSNEDKTNILAFETGSPGVTTATTDGSQSATSNSSSSGRKRRRKRKSDQKSERLGVKGEACGIVPRMLSDKNSLLNQCLKQGKFGQALQVIKMFTMEKTARAKEAKFADQFSITVRRLRSQDTTSVATQVSTDSHSTRANRNSIGRTSLSAIANVAAAGISSMSSSHIVDQILGLSDLPIFDVEESLEMKAQATATNLQRICKTFLEPSNVMGMIVLDLACVACNSWDKTHSLANMADKRLPIQCKVDVSSLIPKVQTQSPGDDKPLQMASMNPGNFGFAKFLQRLDNTLALGSSTTEIYVPFFCRCGVLILTSASLPLDASDLRKLANGMNAVGKELKHVSKTLKTKGIWPYFHQRPKHQNSASSATSALKLLQNCLHKNTPQAGWIDFLLKRSSESGEHQYIQAFIDHVVTLAETVGRLGTDTSHALLQEPFLVLSDSPTTLFGRLIFEAHVEPSSLESVCEMLHIDLTRVLVQSCCPVIPSQTKCSNFQSADTNQSDGKIILNDYEPKRSWRLTQSAELLVRKTLTKLIHLMKETSKRMGNSSMFTPEAAKRLLSSDQLARILLETGSLWNANLNTLTTDKQKLCFLGNVLTLMGIHMWLHHFANDKLSDRKTFDLFSICQNRDQQMACLVWQNKMAYHIGHLGVVSYFELRYLISRQGLSPPSCMEGILQHRKMDLDPDDPWVTFSCPDNPLLTFVVADGTPSGPLLQILHPGLVKQQLIAGTKQFLNGALCVDREAKMIHLSPVLSWYKGDFQKQIQRFVLETDSLHNLLSKSLPEDVRDDVMAAVLSPEGQTFYKVKVIQYMTLQPVYMFCAEAWRKLQWQTENNPRRASLPIGETIPPLWPRPHPTNLDTEISEVYPLNNTALNYLSSRYELLTSVAMVTCHDTNKFQNQLLEDYFPAITPPGEIVRPVLDANRCSQLALYRQKALGEKHPLLSRHLWVNMLPFLTEHNSNMPQLFRATPEHVLENVPVHLENLDAQTRISLLQNANSDRRKRILCNNVKSLLAKKKWGQLLELLHCLSCDVLGHEGLCDLRTLHDHSLCCILTNRLIGCSTVCSHSHKDWTVILKICDPELKARTVLGTLHHWDEGVCLQLLKACLQRDDGRQEKTAIQQLVAKRLSEMKVYEKITLCAKAISSKLNQSDTFTISGVFTQSGESYEDISMAIEDKTNEILQQLCRWQGVVEVSSQCPEMVLEVVTHTKDFETAYSWAHIYNVHDRFEQVLKEVHVSSLLQRDVPDTTEPFQVLEGLRRTDPSKCFQVCCSLLDKLIAKVHVLFVTHFMLTQLKVDLGQRRLQELTTLYIGCKGMLSLPTKEQSAYEHLVSEPLLLLEQVLMNHKVDWAKALLSVYATEIESHDDNQLSFSIEDCDKVLETYATKALEFSILENIMDSPGSDSPGRMSSRPVSVMSNTSQAPRMHRRHNTMTSLTGITAPSLRGFRRTGSASILPGSGPMPFVGSMPIPTTHTRSQFGSNTPGEHEGTQQQGHRSIITFIMPADPPDKSKWVPDSAVTVCMVCSVEHFSMFNRRHHCRRCGRVVCGPCSQKTTIIFGKSARTCDQCFRQIFPTKHVEEQSDLQRLRNRLSSFGPKGVAPSSPGGHSNINITVGSPSPDDNTLADLCPLLETQQSCSEFVYMLSLDEELNQSTREEFYYDHAPSTSLCLSLLDLHSCPQACARVLLSLCDDVSRHLQPLHPGLRNPEVDYGLVLNMLKSMLINAKVKFLKSGDTTGVSQCGVYIDRVNMLDLLLANNCNYLPSIAQLTKPDILRRLRDRLIEEERFMVAMEVSTKCGLDPLGVWTTWGMACLRVGEYSAARDKFAKCLKAPLDKNQTQMPANQKVLNDIVECLENSSISGGPKKFLISLGSVKSLLADPKQKPSEELSLDEPQVQECLYYLQTYGSHVGMVTYYRNHHQVLKAVHYILDMKCSFDVFLDGLLIPSLGSGVVGQLLEQLRHVDPSLEHWLAHLTAACRYLSRIKQINVLYQVQLFMKDYLRAAMTCYDQFYQKGATDYLCLHSRLSSLHQSKRHMETYLAERQWVNRPPPQGVGFRVAKGDDSTLGRMILTPGDVNKYVHAIDTQIEVTKFLYQYHDNFMTRTAIMRGDFSTSAASPSEHRELPTLFGSTKTKADVASLILLCGNNVHDGYGLAFRIIQHFKLDAASIYSYVGQQFGHMQQYNGIKQLLTCIKESGMYSDLVFDEVIDSCVKVLFRNNSDAKELDILIKMFKNDAKKINAYIACGKLKSAYLLAVKQGSVDDVVRIHKVAEETGQSAVSSITQQYLQKRLPSNQK